MLLQAFQPSARAVEIFDDHDEVLGSWGRLKPGQSCLLHFDAHIDFEWVSTPGAGDLLQSSSWSEVAHRIAQTGKGWSAGNLLNRNIHLGNYLHEALASRLFHSWYWIVPDSLWDAREGRRMIRRDLIDLYHFRSGPMEYPRFEKDCFRTAIFEAPVFISSWKNIPEGLEEAVLSIDVDYLTTAFLKKIPPAEDFRRSLPWIWPEEFHHRLRQKEIQWSHAAIARSVRGGFTPIRYKFFGEILKALLEEGELPNGYFDLKESFLERSISRSNGKKSLSPAESLPDEIKASFHYLAAQAHYDQAKTDAARLEYQQCVALDPEFATRNACQGAFYEQSGKWDEALKEYRMMRSLMPDVPEFQEKEARALLAAGRLQEAEDVLAETDSGSAGAGSLMDRAGLAFGQRRFQEARAWYQKAVQAEPANPHALLGLARSQIKIRNYPEARESLRKALGAGAHFPSTYRLLAHVYRKLGYFRKAVEFYFESWRLKLKLIQRAWFCQVARP